MGRTIYFAFRAKIMFEKIDNSKCPRKDCSCYTRVHWYDRQFRLNCCVAKCRCIKKCTKDNQCALKCYERFSFSQLSNDVFREVNT